MNGSHTATFMQVDIQFLNISAHKYIALVHEHRVYCDAIQTLNKEGEKNDEKNTMYWQIVCVCTITFQ